MKQRETDNIYLVITISKSQTEWCFDKYLGDFQYVCKTNVNIMSDPIKLLRLFNTTMNIWKFFVRFVKISVAGQIYSEMALLREIYYFLSKHFSGGWGIP